MAGYAGIVADSNALRVRRSKLHAGGDHSLCKEGRPCRRLALVLGGAVRPAPGGLVAAVAAEFAGGDDATVRELALKLAELADQPGPQSVAACRALGELLAATRGGGEPEPERLAVARRSGSGRRRGS
jgi:hypothetical protein